MPRGIDKIYPRGDSALYEHDLRRWLDEPAIGYAISADMSPQLAECIAALPEGRWKPDKPQIDAIRKCAEVNCLPDDAKKGCRFAALRIARTKCEVRGSAPQVDAMKRQFLRYGSETKSSRGLR